MSGREEEPQLAQWLEPGSMDDVVSCAEKLRSTLEKWSARMVPISEDPPTWEFDTTIALDGWVVTWRVRPENAALTITDLELHPKSETISGLSGSKLAKLSIEGLVQIAGEVLDAADRLRQAQEQIGFRPSRGLRAASSASKTLRGRPRLTDDYFEKLAESYLSEVPLGRKGLYKRIAARIGVDTNVLRNHLNLARDRNWLTRPGPGMPGGEPGDALKNARERRGAPTDPPRTEDS